MKEIDIIINRCNVNGICVGCLNYNRKMFYHEDIKECFWTLADIDIPDDLSVQLCWECLASVRRAWQFRSQLLMSYNILNCYSRMHTFLNSPLDLTQYSTTRLSLSKVEINEDNDFQPVLLKEEIDNDTNQVKLDEDTEFQQVLLNEEIVDNTDQVKLDEDTEFQPVLLKEEIVYDTDQVKLDEDTEFQPVLVNEEIFDDTDQVKLELEDKLVDFETLNTEDQIFDHDGDFQLEDFSQEPEPSSEDDVQLSKLKQRKERKKVKNRVKSDEKKVLHLLKKRKSNIETEKEILKREAPLKITNKGEENKVQNEDNFKIRHKRFKIPIKTIISNNETSTSNINSDIKNSKSEANSEEQFTDPNNIFICNVCKKKYLCKSLLENHIKKWHVFEFNRKPNKINLDCNTKYQNCKNNNRLKGKDVHNYNKLRENKLRKNKNQAKDHFCNDEKPYKCNYCANFFTTSSKLARHVRTHTGEKPYKCSYCTKCFTLRSTLDTHVRIHTGEKPYQCSYCTKSFTKNCALAVHVRIHTGEKPYKCSYCSKCFSNNSNLDSHVRIHTRVKPHKCSYCTKCFTRRSTLDTHVRIHTGEKPYKCSYCTKCFTLRSTLDTHVRIHTGEKPYQCSYCTKCFIKSSELTAHVRIHTGERPHKCSYCTKCFSRSGCLVRHLRIHTGEKPYKCRYCRKCFIQHSHLVNHVRIHTGEKRYKCSYCIKSFSCNGNLASHIRIHTRD